jgi:hypothetical protein
LATVALAATALAVGGCGGSSQPLTRAELTSKADAICKRVSGKLAAKTVTSVQDVARTAPELAAVEQEALNELSKLEPPASIENDWKVFIAGAQKLAENTSKLGEYAKSNSLKGTAGLIASSEQTVKQMTAIAKKYGITDCEQVP